jgi:hypothetical protein
VENGSVGVSTRHRGRLEEKEGSTVIGVGQGVRRGGEVTGARIWDPRWSKIRQPSVAQSAGPGGRSTRKVTSRGWTNQSGRPARPGTIEVGARKGREEKW